jgi:hypothetical protein
MSESAENLDIEEIERVAVELATLAGAEIQAALGSMIAVRYKGESPEKTLWRDPVSEVDHRVETLIRARVAERFPKHDVIGEEILDRTTLHDCVWVVDPIDGTTNFVNGFPMFAASIGVLRRGQPIVAQCGVRPDTRFGRAFITPAQAANSVLKTPTLLPRSIRRCDADLPVYQPRWRMTEIGRRAKQVRQQSNARLLQLECCASPVLKARTFGMSPAVLFWCKRLAAPFVNILEKNGCLFPPSCQSSRLSAENRTFVFGDTLLLLVRLTPLNSCVVYCQDVRRPQSQKECNDSRPSR